MTVSVVDAVEYGALRAGLGMLRLVPWRAAGAIAARVASIGYWPLGVRRSVVESQIRAAFPDWDRGRVERVARASYENLGRTAIEAALLPGLSQAQVRDLFEGDGDWPVFAAAHAQDRGVIVVTGHIGNWELAGAYIAARGVPITGVVRRMQNPLVDGYLTRIRERTGLMVVADDPVRKVPRALKSGQVVALVERIDVHDTGDRERDIDDVVRRYTSTLEKWVREYPEQYLWQHRRWKRRQEEEAELERIEAGERVGR